MKRTLLVLMISLGLIVSVASMALSYDAGGGDDNGYSGTVAIGSDAETTASQSVAIGAGSVADEEYTFSVGDTGSERRITNVAPGKDSTDAVNMQQLNIVNSRVSNQLNMINQDRERITGLEGRMDTAETDIDNLDGRMTEAEGDIDGLQEDVTGLQEDVGDLQGRMDTAETNIDDLDGRVTENETDIENLDDRVTVNEGDIVNLDNRVTVNETDIEAIQAHDKGFDWTAGGGGHTREILKKCEKSGLVVAIDQDAIALEHLQNNFINWREL